MRDLLFCHYWSCGSQESPWGSQACRGHPIQRCVAEESPCHQKGSWCCVTMAFLSSGMRTACSQLLGKWNTYFPSMGFVTACLVLRSWSVCSNATLVRAVQEDGGGREESRLSACRARLDAGQEKCETWDCFGTGALHAGERWWFLCLTRPTTVNSITQHA